MRAIIGPTDVTITNVYRKLRIMLLLLQLLLLTTMHALNVGLELLWLAKFTTTKITKWTRTIRIGRTTVCAMHFQVVEPQEELVAKLALIGALALVLLSRMFHDVVLAEHRLATYFAMVFAYGEAH